MTKNVFGIGLLLLLIVLHVLSSGILKLSGPANAFIYFTETMVLFVFYWIICIKANRLDILIKQNLNFQVINNITVLFLCLSLLNADFFFFGHNIITQIIYLIFFYCIVWYMLVKKYYFELKNAIYFIDKVRMTDYRISLIDVLGIQLLKKSFEIKVDLKTYIGDKRLNNTKLFTIDIEDEEWSKLKKSKDINIDLINKEVNWIIQEILRENKTKGENLIKTSYNNPPLSIIVH
ncbi:MAG: hypothetical protein US83_C0006G0080 [Candidatus Falkowbacteria bacterium GW2011_GWC2_38_22]|uniref:Uncharacterized protein n=1 Tax=Candidatus Falkowbacteria bacterium GW2011_GWE1_38_31 TaxID=1618638 RepID=A0A0G0MBD6_9BACT|nr:MAG: hypothetical protein US73_C0001G0006 [Candidatus Falkowbacteria bacterium GW2011_GWF2_38_1205]KKQ61440.1 MAG: hypothetical protein US83_C0006G0080 [Candidatus Falkowbacteria bacterium GW2011_GWC2_38_22]KKQ63974.1 MAG: hypothetical protein US84_C0002G0006 [Candidatus Falkowbacteria bacterium GW2011_GWF1_38_22]KKQ66677.1 MAG: hypothetical protein US87_C0001G0198 [Candidatus Falkowbacteria bacterium GW2011_GWE2_38_254]KKQ71079.1 MAG: hypothetical protein US91_C0001G0006 [Candidatus Falkowb